MKTALVLIDCDLRLQDNPALFYACRDHENVTPIFILDEKNKRKNGAATKWFLHHALKSFATELAQKNALKLVLQKGDSLEILREIFSSKKVDSIYFNRGANQPSIWLQSEIKKLAEEHLVTVFDFKAATIFEPSEIKNGSGNYFKVFTPFWKNCLKNSDAILDVLPAPKKTFPSRQISFSGELNLSELNLLPQKKWSEKFTEIWEFDYEKITENFYDFLENKVEHYGEGRDIPSLEGTSKMSPYLHFGMISPRQIFHFVKKIPSSQGTAKFLTEIGWREFCHHLLFHFPELPKKSFRTEFENFPWQKNPSALRQWQMGQTGFPIVDAGMRELWATGFMHNRVRMIVASFLVKDLLIDWREGEEWFWDCLVDADLANNIANWQWVAGSGADAAPYFRIFNPTLQGERFDAAGNYVRKWIPEIAKLPNRFIHKPWEADEKLLQYCEIKLGENYPNRIVDHKTAHEFALLAFKSLKN